MGLFSLASTSLSMYIWSSTMYQVYRPLSSSLSAATPSLHPSLLLALLQQALMGSSPDANGQQQQARRTRRRKHVTLAEAQREEVRDSLKVLLIWLVCKGVEPACDSTLGYVVPLYTVVKVIALLVFARFRAQLANHLFDCFVAPLARPNTPLVNSTALTALVFPTVRFLLSLPFAHLAVALKNAAAPFLSPWIGEAVEEAVTSAAATPTTRRAAAAGSSLEARKVSSTSATSRRNSRPGSGGDGASGSGGGGAGGSRIPLKSQRSVGALSTTRPSVADNTPRPRSVSSRQTAAEHAAFAQLQGLPSVPRELPSSIPATFAHIPTSTGRALDFVLPPSNNAVPYTANPMPFLTPKMPGFLSGQGGATFGPTFGQTGGSVIQPIQIDEDEVGDDSVLAARSAQNGAAASLLPTGLRLAASTSNGVEASASGERQNGAKGKRKAGLVEAIDDATASVAKTRSPPSTRTRVERGTTSTTRKKKTAADEKGTATSTKPGARKTPSVTTRTRSNQTSRANSVEQPDPTTIATTRSRRRAE